MSAISPAPSTLSKPKDRDSIEPSNIAAQLDDGVLTLTLKKAKEAIARKIAIS